jgi:DNA-binding protein H-NS
MSKDTDTRRSTRPDGIDAAMQEALDAMGVPELTALIDAAERKRLEKAEGARRDLLAEFEARAAELGTTLQDLLPSVAPTTSGLRRRGTRDKSESKGGDGRRKPAAKYKGPHGEAWSGRGRTPRWLQALEAEGRDRREFLVAA